MPIPLFDTNAQVAPFLPELGARATAVLASGTTIRGPEVKAFEQELGAYLGARHVIGVGNGTDAITLALRALGVGPGDEVVVPSFTFWASAEAIPPTGATPVFCDVDPDTLCITAETVRVAMTPRTKAVVAVDLFGNAAPIPSIRDLGVPVVEDAAQAAGASLDGRMAGALGTVGTLSFYPSKNLGGFGDGGACITDDDDLAAQLRMLHNHGSRDRKFYEIIGFNSRLDELQAAFLRVLLPQLDGWVAGRRAAVEHYRTAGIEELVQTLRPVDGADPAWHLYVIRHPDADAISAALTKQGIENRGYYRTPVHRQPAMARYVGEADLPVTEEAARTHLAIPMGTTIGAYEAHAVVAAIRGAVDGSVVAAGTAATQR